MFLPVVFISVFLLFNAPYVRYASFPRSHSIKVNLDHLSKKEKIVVKGLVLGQKPRHKEIKKAIDNLHIHHLFTPSGIHLSSILWFFSFFSLKRLSLFLFLPLVFFLQGFFAFKRVYFIKLLGELLKIKGFYIDSKYLFFLVFTIEFIFRAQMNFLSFTYSFLFLGIIYSFRKSSPMVLIFGLWFGQALISCFNKDFIYLFSLPVNTLITFITALIYPLIILNTFLPIGIGVFLYDLILFLNYFLVAGDIKVNTIMLTVLLMMVLEPRSRKAGLLALGFISIKLY